MRKTIAAISVIFAVVFLAGCGNKQTGSSSKFVSAAQKSQQPESQPQVKNPQETLTVDGAIEKFKAAGLSVGPKQEAYYQMIGAYDGTKVDIGKINVEIYQFKAAQKNAEKQADQSLATADSTIFENGSLLVIVHSTDSNFVDSLKTALDK